LRPSTSAFERTPVAESETQPLRAALKIQPRATPTTFHCSLTFLFFTSQEKVDCPPPPLQPLSPHLLPLISPVCELGTYRVSWWIVTMSQIRGTAGYNISNQHSFGGPSTDMSNDPSPLDAIREQTSKIEDFLDTLSDPIKPYVLQTPSRTCVALRRSIFERGTRRRDGAAAKYASTDICRQSDVS
jgi:hypothetical protein